MPRPRSVDVVTEWTAVRTTLAEVERRPLDGWKLGWSDAQMCEAMAWALYARSEAYRRRRRLRRIHAARMRRTKRT
jgi:hypothetical protein